MWFVEMISQRGFGLTEILISLFLASFIMIALMNHYLGIKYHYLDFQARLDEATELQLTTDFMRDSIRQAGFTPCLNVENLTVFDQRDGSMHLSAVNIDAGLYVHRMSSEFDVIHDIPQGSTYLVLNAHPIRHADRPVMVADCYHAEVHRITTIRNTLKGQEITLANSLHFIYESPVYIGEWLEDRFFVSARGGLFYQRNHPEELTPLVQSMNLQWKDRVITIHLGLKNGREWKIETKVRSG
jgi:hypothetical protein